MNRVFEKKYLLAISLVTIFSVLFFTVFKGENKKTTQDTFTSTELGSESNVSKSTMSGTIVLSGFIPQGSKVEVQTRKVGESSYTTIATLPASSKVNWTYSNAESGVPYEVKSILKTPTQIFESTQLTVVAPSQNKNMTLVSRAAPQNNVLGKIAGQLAINGQIPAGATVSLFQKVKGSTQDFQVFGQNMQAENGLNWQWNGGKTGTTYELLAQLVQNGQVLGSSTVTSAQAPSTETLLTLNPVTTPNTDQTTGISGTIDLNGTIPPKSFISLGVREQGERTFKTAGTNIAAQDGVTWSWNDGEHGKVYEVQAYTEFAGTPIAQSDIVAMSAPSQGKILTMNVNYQPPAPTASSLTITCIAKDSRNKWQVRLTMNSDEKVKEVQRYSLKFGTVNNSTEFVDSQIYPTDPNRQESLTTDYVLTQNTTYYAKYAYDNTGILSAYSPSVQVSCKN